jgi:hypothetical protein
MDHHIQELTEFFLAVFNLYPKHKMILLLANYFLSFVTILVASYFASFLLAVIVIVKPTTPSVGNCFTDVIGCRQLGEMGALWIGIFLKMNDPECIMSAHENTVLYMKRTTDRYEYMSLYC